MGDRVVKVVVEERIKHGQVRYIVIKVQDPEMDFVCPNVQEL